MESFHNLMVSCSNQKEVAKKIKDEKRAEDSLNEGLNLIANILCEIEAKKSVRGRKCDSLMDLLCDLQSYTCFAIGNERKNIPYITAELGSVIISKLIDIHETSEQLPIIHGSLIENNFRLCSCNSFSVRKELHDVIDILKQLKILDKLLVNSFTSSVIDLRLPVVILGALEKADLLPVGIYVIHIINRKDELHHFIRDLISHLGRSHSENDKTSSLKFCEASVQLLVTLLQLGLGEDIVEPGHAILQLCNQACRDFVHAFLKELTDCVLSEEKPASLGEHFLQLCERKWHVGEKALQEYLLLCLQALAIGSNVSADQALASQHLWLCVEVQPSVKNYLSNLLTAMGQEAAHICILSMIDDESCKWQSILSFITAYLTNFTGAAEALKVSVDAYLTRALTKHRQALLACAFLLARQACFTSGVSTVRNVFLSYGAWFGSAFGVEAGSVQTSTDPASFTFLMDFLTYLVPTDPPLCIRVHINKVPSAPAHCGHLLADFVSLAKTRLQDLGEATGSGLFAFENTPEEDVKTALMHFETSRGQISRVLLDSSKFRRTQFERQFLPALLVPEPICEVRSSRQLLITELQVAGKIPLSMLQQYEMACQHLSSQHSGQRKSGPVTGTPIARWQSVLEFLVSTLRDNGVNELGDLTHEGESALSAASGQLEPLLCYATEQIDSGPILQKVVGRFLKACELCFEPPTPSGMKKSSVWLSRIVTLLMSQPVLMRQFWVAVYDIACNISLASHVTEVAAALACIWDYHKEDGISFKSTVSDDCEKLGETIGKALHPTTEKRMLHALTFCSTYLGRVHEISAGSSPCCTPTPLRKSVYLHERLLHSSDPIILGAVSLAWSPPPSWADVVSEVQLSLEDWLELEAVIDRAEDPLKIRYSYLSEWITQHCDHRASPDLLIASLTYADKGCGSWSNELLQIIPSIGDSLESSGKSVPWLIKTWMDISTRFSHQSVLKAVQCLPPWMLLTNNLGVKPTCDSISTLSDFIYKHMDRMSEKGFLSLQILSMIIGAVRAAAAPSKGDVLSQILDSCPALHVSLLRHGYQLHLQLVPSFTTCCSSGCSLERIMIIVTAGADCWQKASGCLVWEAGLASWSQGASLPKTDDGSLFFHLMDIGTKLLQGSICMVMALQGPVLPSTMPMASLLVQQPCHCLKMLKEGTKIRPLCLPSTGISLEGRAALSLATMGVLLSLDSNQLPCPGEEASKLCCQVLQQCLCLWKEVCLELDHCNSRVQEVSFVRWLARRIQILIEYFLKK